MLSELEWKYVVLLSLYAICNFAPGYYYFLHIQRFKILLLVSF